MRALPGGHPLPTIRYSVCEYFTQLLIISSSSLSLPTGPVASSGPHTSCGWHRRVGRLHPYLHPIPPLLRPAHELAKRGKLAAKTVLKPRRPHKTVHYSCTRLRPCRVCGRARRECSHATLFRAATRHISMWRRSPGRQPAPARDAFFFTTRRFGASLRMIRMPTRRDHLQLRGKLSHASQATRPRPERGPKV